jgi:hypothetical protein
LAALTLTTLRFCLYVLTVLTWQSTILSLRGWNKYHVLQKVGETCTYEVAHKGFFNDEKKLQVIMGNENRERVEILRASHYFMARLVLRSLESQFFRYFTFFRSQKCNVVQKEHLRFKNDVNVANNILSWTAMSLECGSDTARQIRS